jgi:Ion channel
VRPAELRRRFLAAFCRELRVVWPILSALVLIQLALGFIVGFLERWPVGDSVYFTFVTGLTIGYGDLVPARLVARLIALMIGFIGILLTGLVAALGVRALQETTSDTSRR